jgi:hypothetical protein
MNAATDNLRTDRVPLVIPELRVGENEWGDLRVDPTPVAKVPILGWIPQQALATTAAVAQATQGGNAATANAMAIALLCPSVDEIALEKSWPEFIDSCVMANRRNQMKESNLPGLSAYYSVLPTPPMHSPVRESKNYGEDPMKFQSQNVSCFKEDPSRMPSSCIAPARSLSQFDIIAQSVPAPPRGAW